MYGKIFESLYRGSMIGSGSEMFAVWTYVIANMRADESVGAQVDLNPKLLAFILGEEESVIDKVLHKLCEPDPKSTSKKEEGRRLIRLGEFAYRVVNGADYMVIRNEDERREYFRFKKRESRDKTKSQQALEEAREIERQARHKEVGVRKSKKAGQIIGAHEALVNGFAEQEKTMEGRHEAGA